jgi:hypothetical protein
MITQGAYYKAAAMEDPLVMELWVYSSWFILPPNQSTLKLQIMNSSTADDQNLNYNEER